MGINDTILVTLRGENNQDLYVENIQFFYVKFRHPSVNVITLAEYKLTFMNKL